MIKVLLLASFISALVALACVPAIFYLESLGRPQNPFHMIQLLTCLVCFPCSGSFFWMSRGLGWTATRIFTALACLLSGAWFGYFVYVMVMMALLGA
ncbi:hypothetical protein N9A58_09095 [Opitutales bacterium]|jgi:hypothetical protein|nr:hypothetical protein [Opitutales bacterium]